MKAFLTKQKGFSKAKTSLNPHDLRISSLREAVARRKALKQNNTKIVLTGDIEQIDNVYTNETSNGLTYAIEKFKESTLSGHITFKKGERSKLATEASKLL